MGKCAARQFCARRAFGKREGAGRSGILGHEKSQKSTKKPGPDFCVFLRLFVAKKSRDLDWFQPVTFISEIYSDASPKPGLPPVAARN